MQKNQIQYEEKRIFNVKIFSLLTDFSNEKIWESAKAKDLENLIEKYSKLDREFVKNVMSKQEKKIGQKVSAALYAAKGV